MSDDVVKDYEVTIRIKNNWMLKAMRAAGYETGKQLERASGVSCQVIYKFLSLQIPFLRDDGTWNPHAITIADALGCHPDALVPPQHLKEVLAKNTGTFEADFDDVQNLIESRAHADPLTLIENKEKSQAIKDAMIARLSPRERKAVVLSFGLDGGGERTLEEVGAEIGGISTERARQIIVKATRRLKIGGLMLNPGKVPAKSQTDAAERLAEFAPK